MNVTNCLYRSLQDYSALFAAACLFMIRLQHRSYYTEVCMSRIVKIIGVITLITALSGCLFPPPGGGGHGGGGHGGGGGSHMAPR
ncbi:hypothetical protein DDT52_12410 [Brenneria roseae subsp. roseae]|nr:hypothetical protein DDT52_12410 [Brenneria roseae subsp. roseae]